MFNVTDIPITKMPGIAPAASQVVPSPGKRSRQWHWKLGGVGIFATADVLVRTTLAADVVIGHLN